MKARGLCGTHWLRWRKTGDPGDNSDQRATRHVVRLCSIDGCEKKHLSRGWCEMHYMRWYTTGTTDLSPQRTPEERFWAQVEQTQTCWLWTGHLVSGYGRFWLNGNSLQAHRYSYELLVGPIPDGLHLDHVVDRGCTHTNCVNPAHLEPVTPGENTRRQRRHTQRTHCVNGHPYENNRGAGRRCIICHRERMRQYYARLREEKAARL